MHSGLSGSTRAQRKTQKGGSIRASGKNSKNISAEEMARRKKQSSDDKKRNARQAAQPRRQDAGLSTQWRSAKSLPAGRKAPHLSLLDRHMVCLRSGLPCPVPSRLEVMHFRARLPLGIPNTSLVSDTNWRAPMILFYPNNSIAHSIIGNYNVTSFDLSKSGDTDSPGRHNWVNSDAVRTDGGTFGATPQGVIVNAFTSVTTSAWVAEAISTPQSLIKADARITGGMVTIKVTGSPGSSGFMSVSSPTVAEYSDLQNAYQWHAGSNRVKRFELREGVQEFTFYAPLMNPPALEEFQPVRLSMTYSTTDPYGPLLFSFHDLVWNQTFGLPFHIEYQTQVGLQLRLDIDDRHFATNHPVMKRHAKEDAHTNTDPSSGGGGTHIPGSGAAAKFNQSPGLEMPSTR